MEKYPEINLKGENYDPPGERSAASSTKKLTKHLLILRTEHVHLKNSSRSEIRVDGVDRQLLRYLRFPRNGNTDILALGDREQTICYYDDVLLHKHARGATH